MTKSTERGTTHTPLTLCPACGYAMDCASTPDGRDVSPDPGDFSVCLNCAAILVFTESMHLRSATLWEANEAPAELLGLVRIIAMRGRFK